MPGPDYCDVDVLRRIRRRSLAALRADVEPVPPEVFAGFLPGWHEVGRLRGVDGVAAAVETLAGTPVAASALESLVLPARVVDYRPEYLDELTTSGEVVWIGAGASATGLEGWVALVPADAVADLAPDRRVEITELSQPARWILEIFAARPAGVGRFARELAPEVAARAGATAPPLPPPTPAEFAEAIWELAWAGFLSNDSLAPLRARLGGSAHPATLAAPATRATRATRAPRARSGLRSMRARRRIDAPSTTAPHLSGRWSLVPGAGEATARILGRSLALVDRDGVVLRGSVPEGLPGGFGSVYRVLARAEESGQVRRGYFVEGLGAAQFALPEAVERLRAAAAPAPGPPSGLVLAATDPAQAYGAALAWPEACGPGGHRPGRKIGACVALVAGRLVFYLERGGRSLLTFTTEPGVLAIAADALAEAIRAGRLGRITLTTIDGAAALTGAAATAALRGAGFVPHPRGLRLRGAMSRPESVSPAAETTAASGPGAGSGPGSGLESAGGCVDA
ncbi:hypothetical protein GCE65_10355 [Pseudactinotalea sp. HY158]|nr:hypothetical protein GCE65_10355 [Pseudactinotalea sp. HY158]